MSPERRAVNLATLLTATARRLPDHDAVVQGAQRWSWAQIDAAAHAVAVELRARGVEPGDCVLVHSPNHVEFVAVMFGIWRAGAVFAPTNSRLTPDDVAVIAQACRPTAFACHTSAPEHADAILTTTQGQALWIGGDGPDAVSSIIAAAHPRRPTGASDPDAAANTDTREAAAGETGTDRTSPVFECFDAPVNLGDPAWYFFTSGTSGAPKAAVLTHDQMGFVVTNHLADLMPGTTEHDTSLVLAPLSHGAGIHLLPQVARGATSVLTASDGLDGAEVWELVEREQVSNMFTVPTILKKIAEHPEAKERDHTSLRHVIYAGAPMYAADQDHAREVLGEVLVQYYGLGEVTGNITVLTPQEHTRPRPDGVEFATCGRARTGMEVVVRAPEGDILPAGATGEICVAGPAVCHGYLHNDEADAAAFRDGWFHTGDLGLFDAEGYLYITGRASDMYISGGSNIHPRDIEEKLVAHPAVSETAVLGMPHPLWGEVGVAVWVPASGPAVDPPELVAWLESRLARYKLPRHFLCWSELPKSGYGKVAKRTIREKLLAAGWSDGAPGDCA